MKKKRISLNFGKSEFSVDVRPVRGFGRVRGLMFRSKKNAETLAFEFPHFTRMAIHSMFVFFPFLVVWLDDKNNVLEYKVVKPFVPYVVPKKNFKTLVEIPLGKGYEKGLFPSTETFK